MREAVTAPSANKFRCEFKNGRISAIEIEGAPVDFFPSDVDAFVTDTARGWWHLLGHHPARSKFLAMTVVAGGWQRTQVDFAEQERDGWIEGVIARVSS